MADEYSVVRWSGKSQPESRHLRETLISEGYDVFEWTDAPGTVYEMHSHPTDQSHWIVSGRLELSVERIGQFVLRAGDRDFMPAGTQHSARVVGGENVCYLIGSKH